MNCASCQAILHDLRRGGLPARTEAEARSHLAQCSRCRAAHMRLLRDDELASGAPSAPTAPAAVVTAAALAWVRRLRQKRQDKALARQVDVRVQSHGALALLGRLAMAPQVAMSTVMLLIVLVGLWSLPQLTRRQGPRFGEHFTHGHVGHSTIRADTAWVRVDSAARVMPAVHKADARRDAAGGSDPRVRADESRRVGPRAARVARGQGQGRRSDLQLAMQYYRAHEYARATPLFSRALISASSTSEHAQALLYVARAERALGHCDRAVNSYDTLVRVHPTRAEAIAALREGVLCYDRLGEGARAQRLIEQAAQTRQLLPSARRLIHERAAISARKARARNRARKTPEH